MATHRVAIYTKAPHAAASDEHDIESFRAKLVEDYPPPPRMFSIISWGCAATGWVSRVLNSHPDLFCVHAAANLWSIMTGHPRVSGADYLRLVGMMGTEHKAAGDVHGLSRHEVPALRTEFPSLGVAVIVREPYSRLRSAIAMWDRLGWENMALNPEIAELTLPQKQKGQVQLARLLNEVVAERDIAPIYRSEDLTSDKAALADFVSTITGDAVVAGPRWLERALAIPAQNRHTPASSIDDREVQALADRYLSDAARRIYASLGYHV